MHAARTLRLCTKDCVCLFVCPTGATNTENGQIDASKCLDGCRRCVDTCPSHAISLVVDNYPALPFKNSETEKALLALLDRKYVEEKTAKTIGASTGASGKILATALAASLRIVAEDAAREANFLVPQNKSTIALIERLLEEKPFIEGKQFPEAELKELLSLLSN